MAYATTSVSVLSQTTLEKLMLVSGVVRRQLTSMLQCEMLGGFKTDAFPRGG